MIKKIMLVIALSFFLLVGKGQQTYNYVFNPVKGMVSEVEKPVRNEICLNGKWKIMPLYNVKAVDFTLPDSFKWEKVAIKIPSPWNVNASDLGLRPDGTKGEGGDFLTFPSYPEKWESAKIAWMERKFTVPLTWSGKRKLLHFQAVSGKTHVYVNGKLVGVRFEPYLPFEIDVTDFINEKSENTLLVGVAAGELFDIPGSNGHRTYVGGSFFGTNMWGIWQDVYLFSRNPVYVSNVFVKPEVNKQTLNVEVTIKNTTASAAKVRLNAVVRAWKNLSGMDVNEAPVENGTLDNAKALSFHGDEVAVPALTEMKVTLIKTIKNELKYWTPSTPNLYGLVIEARLKNKKTDISYNRFGWRQFSIEGSNLLLNGTPINLNGDSWHFMGVPQMTRRYAWAWFKMLKEANGNAVRLHAMPYPGYYLDIADEMGICVLDETGIWASDGGPKYDSDEYWENCKSHVAGFILRDRNHPSVFGWSVCNENIPVALWVYHSPDSLVKVVDKQINSWIDITKKLDPTRDWISGDGETDRPLNFPTYVGHYGGEDAMISWGSHGKPWGVGEQGMAYYGTPAQVAGINGNRAYESQQGRMEGLASEAYELIKKQKAHNASYASVFNLVWYGLQPLEIGLKDTTRKSNPTDGIFFKPFTESTPGIQPERLGPYCTTLNPGYDSSIPLYRPWPMFNAIKAANASPIQPFSIPVIKQEQSKPDSVPFNKIFLWASSQGVLSAKLASIGLLGTKEFSVKKNERCLLIIDGSMPLPTLASKQFVDKIIQYGGTVLVWGAEPEMLDPLNAVLPQNIELTNRTAISFIVRQTDPLIAGMGNNNFYFCEMSKTPILTHGITGSVAEGSKVILAACNTDWNRWNYKPENIKTAAVFRSEREKKEGGNAIIMKQTGAGKIYVSTLNLFDSQIEGKILFKEMLYNIGVRFGSVGKDEINALLPDGTLSRALVSGNFNGKSGNVSEIFKADIPAGWKFINPKVGGRTEDHFWEVTNANSSDIFDFLKLNLLGSKEFASALLSFWVYSPRSLVNLLAEPDMPELDMFGGGDDGFEISLNGKSIATANREGPLTKDEFKFRSIPLEKGWNHFVVRVVQGQGGWSFTLRFDSQNKTFMNQLKSKVEN